MKKPLAPVKRIFYYLSLSTDYSMSCIKIYYLYKVFNSF